VSTSFDPAPEDVRLCPRGANLGVTLTRPVGVYSRSTGRIVVVVYAARAEGTPTRTEEALEVQAFRPTTIPWDHLAFWSDGRALRDDLDRSPAASARAGSS